MTNRQWRLASHPQGMPTLETWSLHEAPIPEPGPGLPLRPAQRGSAGPSTRVNTPPKAGNTSFESPLRESRGGPSKRKGRREPTAFIMLANRSGFRIHPVRSRLAPRTPPPVEDMVKTRHIAYP